MIRTLISMKDYIENALILAFISLLFTRGLLIIALAGIDISVKIPLALVSGFFATIFWWATLSTVKKIVSRTLPKDVEPLWLSKASGMKRVAVLALLAASSVAAAYILVRVIQQPADPFETALYVYIAFVVWITFVLEVAYTKARRSELGSGN